MIGNSTCLLIFSPDLWHHQPSCKCVEKFATEPLLNAWGGGALFTIVGAMMGRAMWHSNEARKGRRKFIGIELLWEIPVAFGMAFIGEGISSYLNVPAGNDRPYSRAGLSRAARDGSSVSEMVFPARGWPIDTELKAASRTPGGFFRCNVPTRLAWLPPLSVFPLACSRSPPLFS